MTKILLLRLSSIGDIVLTTPVVRCLKQQTGAEIHFLTKQAFQSVLEPNPYLDRLHFFQKKLDEVLPVLRQERFDWIIDLHGNWRTWRIKWALRRPARTFNKLNLEKWLLVRFGINWLPDRHIVDRYLETVAHLGVQYDGHGLDYFIPAAAEVNPAEVHPILENGNFVVFNIGANHATKRLPDDQITAICRAMERPVVLLGGKAEMPAGERIAAAAGNRVVDCCGRLSLHQSASMIRQSAQVISHDSGLMHIAAALGKDIISVWGNTVPAFGMYPKYPDGVDGNTSMEVAGLPCRPCSKIGYTQCPKGHFKCMREQDISAILAAVK